MPSPQRARNGRMKLRHSSEMADLASSILQKVTLILDEKVAVTGSVCTSGELTAAARYLAKSLAEYDLRRRKRVPDALYTPLDEVYWREDLALKTDPANQALIEKIAIARSLRGQAFQEPEHGQGGARYALTNAIRHAWLICHDGSERVNYGRMTTSDQEHYGPLHDFILSLNGLIQFSPNADGLHRDVQALDLQLFANMTVP